MRTLVQLILMFYVVVPELEAQDDVYAVEKLPFSSGLYDEYAPVPYEDGLVYVANYRLDFFYTFNKIRHPRPISDYQPLRE